MLCLPVQYTQNNLPLFDSLDKAHKYWDQRYTSLRIEIWKLEKMENIDFIKENDLVVNADEISLFLEQNQVYFL